MSYSGDAAEQVVRMTLEGAEVAAKITGAGAKQVAILLYAVLRDQKKTKGRTRLTNMLRSGKELKVFAVKDTDLQRFCTEAKKYGVLYCVLKDKNANDGITDIMVRAEDASKINRIFERFQLATVDMGSVKSEIERSRLGKASEDISAPERSAPEPDKDERFLDALLQPAPSKEEGQTQNPFIGPPQDRQILRGEEEQGRERSFPHSGKRSGADFATTKARVAKSRQSEPTSKPKEQAARGISDEPVRSRPSVRQELNEIKAEQRQKAAASKERTQTTKPADHKEPPKKKSKKTKER